MLTPTSTTFVFDADVNSGGQFKACCKRLELKVTQVNSFLECLLSKAGLLLVLFVCLFVNSTFSHNSKLKNNNRALVFFFFFFLSFLFFFVVLWPWKQFNNNNIKRSHERAKLLRGYRHAVFQRSRQFKQHLTKRQLYAFTVLRWPCGWVGVTIQQWFCSNRVSTTDFLIWQTQKLLQTCSWLCLNIKTITQSLNIPD